MAAITVPRACSAHSVERSAWREAPWTVVEDITAPRAWCAETADVIRPIALRPPVASAITSFFREVMEANRNANQIGQESPVQASEIVAPSRADLAKGFLTFVCVPCAEPTLPTVLIHSEIALA